MKIYDIIKPQPSPTNLFYVDANGYVLSELGRLSRSLKRQTEGEKLLWGKYKIGSYVIDYHVFRPLAIFFLNVESQNKTLNVISYVEQAG
jgi:hypothetical protein